MLDQTVPLPDQTVPPARYAPAIPFPPYSYVPGHELPHPINDPAGHLYAGRDSPHEPPITSSQFSALPTQPASRRRALAATLAANARWLYALDLFNAGFYWEAHEVWEGFWHALGRTTPEAQSVQGLIHLTAACVKIREGKAAGVRSHTQRARELMAQVEAANDGGERGESSACLGIVPDSLAAVFTELDNYKPECWHTSRFPAVKVLVAGLQQGS
jgi:hypothetical protein